MRNKVIAMRRKVRKLVNIYACFLTAFLFIFGLLSALSPNSVKRECIRGVRSLAMSAFGIFNRLNASRYVRAAEEMIAQGNLDKANALLETALKLDAKSFTAYLHLITLRLTRKDVKGADEVLERARLHLPAGQVSHLYTIAGDHCAFFVPVDAKVMERYYREALKLNPKNATALNNYGYALTERGIKLDEAEKLIKSALKIEPNNAAFIDSMGWVYYKKGQYDDAIKWLERAVRLQPEDAELHYHLGMAYIAVGRDEDGRRELGEALRINPSHEGANRALRELEERKERKQIEETTKGELA